MINLDLRQCAQPSCSKVPFFGAEGEPAVRCVEHKLEGMVNVANRQCRASDCTRKAVYNFAGEKRKIMCGTHKVSFFVFLLSCVRVYVFLILFKSFVCVLASHVFFHH